MSELTNPQFTLHTHHTCPAAFKVAHVLSLLHLAFKRILFPSNFYGFLLTPQSNILSNLKNRKGTKGAMVYRVRPHTSKGFNSD
jgi:hypothetical protein